MNIPEKGRIAAHVLIDAVSVARETGDAEPANLAYQRLLEVGAFAVHVDDSDTEISVSVDLSDVLGASLVTIDWLVQQLAKAEGSNADRVIIDLREAIDA